MKTHKIKLDFEGYLLHDDVKHAPKYPGIYCVYKCIDHYDGESVTLKELLYIGEGDGVKNRIIDHGSKWVNKCSGNEKIYYSVAHVLEKSPKGNQLKNGSLLRELLEGILILNCKNGPKYNKDNENVPNLSTYLEDVSVIISISSTFPPSVPPMYPNKKTLFTN